MRSVFLFACFVALGGTLLIGCRGTGGLLSSSGFASASDVSFVLLGGGHTYKVGDAATVRQLYTAVNHPDRNWVTTMVRNQLMAFVAEDGKVAYLVYEAGGDLTATQGSDEVARILSRVFSTHSYRDTSHIPVERLARVHLSSPKISADVSPNSGAIWGRVRAPLVGLLQSWPSNDLGGSVRCSQETVDRATARADRYIEVDFGRPLTFRTLIVPEGFAWWPPPETVYTRARYEKVRFDRIRVINTRVGAKTKRELKIGEVRLAFGTKAGGAWVLTDVIGTRRYLGPNRDVMSRYGPDLLDEAFSAARH